MVKRAHKVVAPESPSTEPDDPTKIEIKQSDRNARMSASKTLNDVRDNNEKCLREELQRTRESADTERYKADIVNEKYNSLRESHARLDERHRHLKSQRSSSTLAALIGGCLLACASFIDKQLQIPCVCIGATISVIGIGLDIRGCLSEWAAGAVAQKSTQG